MSEFFFFEYFRNLFDKEKCVCVSNELLVHGLSKIGWICVCAAAGGGGLFEPVKRYGCSLADLVLFLYYSKILGSPRKKSFRYSEFTG